ncbi:MAG: DUF58 domain-containing protein [Terriglobales bacterium]
MAGHLKKLLASIDTEAWVRFFIAIGGLVLAFAAAVLSTVTRQAGNLWATALLASASLLIAGAVGMTIVPYLARRVAVGYVRELFDYDITREGLVYFALVLVIGVAALNTGNNMLFIVIAAMLGAVVVSGVASAAVLRGLELEVMMPAHVFAGTPVLARVILRNPRRLPSFSVSVTPPRARRVRRLRTQRTTFAFPARRPPERQWVRLPDVRLTVARDEAPPAIFSAPVYFPYLPGGSTATAELELNFPRRGRYQQRGFGLATRFPFSFLLKTRRLELARELIVYPPVEPTDASLEVLPMITGEFEAFVRGRGHDLYRIREYQPEDPRRHVDWKATAKTGELKVREYTREDERKLRVVFDNPAPDQISETEYEDAVTLAATLAWHFANDSTDLSFAAPGFVSTDLYDFLRYLALVQPEAGEPVLHHIDLTDDYNLIITAQPRGTIPTAVWATSYIVFVGGR